MIQRINATPNIYPNRVSFGGIDYNAKIGTKIVEALTDAAQPPRGKSQWLTKIAQENSMVSCLKEEIIPLLEKSDLTCKQLANYIAKALPSDF